MSMDAMNVDPGMRDRRPVAVVALTLGAMAASLGVGQQPASAEISGLTTELICPSESGSPNANVVATNLRDELIEGTAAYTKEGVEPGPGDSGSFMIEAGDQQSFVSFAKYEDFTFTLAVGGEEESVLVDCEPNETTPPDTSEPDTPPITEPTTTTQPPNNGGEPEVPTGPRDFTNVCRLDRVSQINFSDIQNSPQADAIKCVADLGLANGVTPEIFDPSGRVSRGRMASFLTRLLDRSGRQLPLDMPDRFADDNGDTHELAINQLAAEGIFTGRNDGSAGAGVDVTREQMASLIDRTTQVANGGETLSNAGNTTFPDIADSAHRESVERLAGERITVGVTPEQYDPAGLTRREQMAAFLARTAGLLAERGIVSPL